MFNAVLMAGLSARQFFLVLHSVMQDIFSRTLSRAGMHSIHPHIHKKVELNSEMTDLSIFGSRCPMHSFGCLVTCVIEQFFFHDCAPSRRHGVVVWRVNSVLELMIAFSVRYREAQNINTQILNFNTIAAQWIYVIAGQRPDTCVTRGGARHPHSKCEFFKNIADQLGINWGFYGMGGWPEKCQFD